MFTYFISNAIRESKRDNSMSKKSNRGNTDSPVKQLQLDDNFGDFVTVAEVTIWADVLKVILGEERFKRYMDSFASNWLFNEEGKPIALYVNSQDFPSNPAQRQDLSAAERMAIIKAQAEEILKPEFGQRLQHKRLVEAAQHAATEALGCIARLESIAAGALVPGDAALILREGIRLAAQCTK
jgi:hypothetical protein